MRHRLSIARRPGHRLVWAVALLGLFTLPVEYRGGAEQPHPHGSYQLWFDAAHGMVDHHRRHVVDALAPAAAPIVAVDAGSPPVVIDGGDGPRLSPVSRSADRLPLLPGALVVVAAALLPGVRLAWPAAPALVGTPVRPETPPPRPAVATP